MHFVHTHVQGLELIQTVTGVVQKLSDHGQTNHAYNLEILSYHIARSFHFPFLLFHFQVEFTNDLVILDFPRFLILKAKEEWYLHQDDIFEVAHTQQLHIVPETSSIVPFKIEILRRIH